MPPQAILGAVPGGKEDYDIYQVGRMSAPSNDLTIRGPLYRTSEGIHNLVYAIRMIFSFYSFLNHKYVNFSLLLF